MKKDLDIFKDAYDEGFKFYDENIVMLSWYVRRLISRMRSGNYRSVISLGIGHGVVSRKIIEELGQVLDKYIILEGSQELINQFEKQATTPSNVSLIHGFFEQYRADEKVDAIEMGFVLEHVDDPVFLLKRFAGFLKPQGSVFIAVPNAKSIHRQIGHHAGLLDNIYMLSRYDLELGHKRYFDMESLAKLVLEAGLKIVNMEGILLKPFSASQLKLLNLSPDILEALCSVAVGNPGISNAIYLEATL